MSNKVIALDIGNVCLHIHPERCLALLKDCNCASIPPELLRYEADELERGRVSEADFLAKVREMTGTRASDKTLTDAFLAILGEPVEGMPELVAELPQLGFQAVFFSDTSAIHLAAVRRIFPSARFVPQGVYSFEVGERKPHPAMFEAFEHRFGTPVCYFDDRADLIEAARRHGWNAHQFHSAAEMKKILSAGC